MAKKKKAKTDFKATGEGGVKAKGKADATSDGHIYKHNISNFKSGLADGAKSYAEIRKRLTARKKELEKELAIIEKDLRTSDVPPGSQIRKAILILNS